MNTIRAFPLGLILHGAAVVAACLVGALPLRASAEVSATVPPTVSARLAALIESANTTEQTCVDPDGLATLARSAPAHAIELASAAVRAIVAGRTVLAALAEPTARSQSDAATPFPDGISGDDARCRCLADIAGRIAEVVPDRSGELYRALTDIEPRCRDAVAGEIRRALLDSAPGPGVAAASGPGNPSVLAAPPPRGVPSGGPGGRIPLPKPPGGCASGGPCGIPLPGGDTGVVSPTRLGGRG